MSTLYDCSTPQSTIHLETTDSDEVSENFGAYFIDKHADSIIPTSKAHEIYIKKSKKQESKQVTRSEIQSIQMLFKERLKKILSNFSQNIETFSKIYENRPSKHFETPENDKKSKKPSKSKKISEEPLKIKENIETLNRRRLSLLKKNFEDQKNKIIDQKRDDLQKVWRVKMFELNGKLQQAEWKKSAGQSEEKEKVRSLFQAAYETALKKEKVLLELDIDQHYSQQYAEKLALFRKSLGKEKIVDKFDKEIKEKLDTEKEKWKNDLTGIREAAEKKSCSELISSCLTFESNLRQKYAEEVQNRVSQFKIILLQSKNHESATNFSKKTPSPVKLKEWQEEAMKDFESEKYLENVSDYRSILSSSLQKELSRTLSFSIETKVFKAEQCKIFREVSEELNLTFEFFKREAENLLKKESQEMEDKFIENIDNTVKSRAGPKVLIKEKELHIKFIKKLENLKLRLKQETHEKHLNDLKVIKNQHLKDLLLREKTLFAQLKAKNNISVSKLEEEILQNSQKLLEEQLKLEVKLRELSHKSKLDDEMIFRTEDVITKSTSRHNYSSLIPTDQSKEHHPYFIAPSFSAKEIRARNGSDIKSPRILPDPSPRDLKTQNKSIHSNQVNKLNISNPLNQGPNSKQPNSKNQVKQFKESTSQSLSFDNLKLKSKEKLRNNLIKQSVYHELLKEKFGFIKPRLK